MTKRKSLKAWQRPTNPNPASARTTFQWFFADRYLDEHPDSGQGDDPPTFLNLGCANDPLEFGDVALHADMDDWSAYYKWFQQEDAHKLSFASRVFDLVIMGDIHEHLTDPLKATLEAGRVTKVGGVLVMTIFEEWKLPGYGQWIKEGQANSDQVTRDLEDKVTEVKGRYTDREDYQIKNYPARVGVPDDETPHLIHINQFTDYDIIVMIEALVQRGFRCISYQKIGETVHEGHQWFNWLVAMERMV